MDQTKGKAWDGALFRRILKFANPYMGLMYLALFLTVFLAVIVPLRPFIIGRMVGKYVSEGDEQGLLINAMYVVGLLVLEGVSRFFHIYISNLIGQNVIKDLRVMLFNHITRLKLQYFDTHPIGMLVTRAVSDIETVAEVFSQGILTIFGDLLTIVGVLTFMFYVNWELTLITIIPIPLLIIATNIFKKAIKKSFQDVRKNVSKLNTFVQEHIVGMNIVKIFDREKVEAERFRKINDEHKKAHIRSIWAYSVFFPVVDILSALSIAFLILYIVLQVDDPSVDFPQLAGEMTSFILYIYMLYRPIRMLADRFNTLQMGMVGSSRVFEVLDTEEHIQNTQEITQKEFSGEIEFKNVWFAYNEPTWVLKDLSFNVQPGETIAFVGATGAGKSSVINLLSRFYEYQKGEITLDGDDLRRIDINLIRKKIAVVLQDVFLYSDSILNNITLGNKEISREQVIEAAKLVGAHDFIMNLPGNYDFDVKERGGMLSVGQRQLISFIRAYVYNPAILILDEATSSVDTESEELIQNAINKLTEGRTSIIIAHRLSTIRKADKIIVMEQGGILEIGNHNELIQQDGAYKKLYDLQFKE